MTATHLFELTLDTLAKGEATIDELAARLSASRSSLESLLEVARAESLVQCFALPSGTYWSLTPLGLQKVALGRQLDEALTTGGPLAFLRTLGRVRATSREVVTQEVRADESSVLIDDAVRDRAVQGINQAYAERRLSGDERERRMAAALAARTLGELQAAAGDVVDLGPVAPESATLWTFRTERPADGGRMLLLLLLAVILVPLLFVIASCTVG